jgi:hypothetical protein
MKRRLPSLAHFGSADQGHQCPKLGLNRTWPNDAVMSQIDPKENCEVS